MKGHHKAARRSASCLVLSFLFTVVFSRVMLKIISSLGAIMEKPSED
jgi:hypothetical protein